MSSTNTSTNSTTARRGYVSYQDLKDKHGKKIADRIRDEKRKQQQDMDQSGSTDPPVVKPSEDLPDCEELSVTHIDLNSSSGSIINYNL